MIQPAHLRKHPEMTGIGILSVDEHPESVSVDLGVYVFAILRHEEFLPSGGQLVDSILVEGFSV